MSEEAFVKLKVGGKLYRLCPEDGCTIIDKKYYEDLKDQYFLWTQYGYVCISIKNDINEWYKMPLHIYIS
jgi:hypothetical protein